ncbi:MAG: hypothetical protein ACOC80_16885 [Petrotogales bacterium]
MSRYASRINKRFETSLSNYYTGFDFEYCSWKETYAAMRCSIPYGGGIDE